MLLSPSVLDSVRRTSREQFELLVGPKICYYTVFSIAPLQSPSVRCTARRGSADKKAYDTNVRWSISSIPGTSTTSTSIAHSYQVSGTRMQWFGRMYHTILLLVAVCTAATALLGTNPRVPRAERLAYRRRTQDLFPPPYSLLFHLLYCS